MKDKARDILRSVILWFGGREPVVLGSLLLVVTVVWGFIEITGEVLEGDTQAFDKAVVRALRQADDLAVPVGPHWLMEIGRDITALGGVASLLCFTAVVAGYLWLDGKHRMMAFLLTATITGMLVSFGLKELIDRPRPDVVPHLASVSTSSFPSGHAMLSAVVYLTLGTLLATVTRRRRLKIYVLTVALLLSMLVGLSRIYLGVHYPTDVLAGWMAGLGWALLCWLVARWLQRRREVETAYDGAESATAPEREAPASGRVD